MKSLNLTNCSKIILVHRQQLLTTLSLVSSAKPLRLLCKCSGHSITESVLPIYQAFSSQAAFTFSKLTIETLEQGVKYVQS